MTAGWGRAGHLLVCRAPLPAVVVAMMGLSALAARAETPGGTTLLTAALIAWLLLSLRRGRTLCLWCAADFPLDPGELAQRRRRSLRLHHQTAGLGWTVVLVLGPLLGLVVLQAAVDLPRPAVELGIAAALMPLAVVAQAGVVHTRLQPWCPWCRRGGGDGERSPDPAPDPVICQPV